MNYWSARLLNANELVVTLPQLLTPSQIPSIRVQVNHRDLIPLTLLKEEKGHGYYVYTFFFSPRFQLGHGYFLIIEGVGTLPIHLEALMQQEDFPRLFDASKETLGYQYTPTSTTFQVWAPLASTVSLIFYAVDGEKQSIYPMQRKPNGVYTITVKGNCDQQAYRYAVINHGLYQETIDPYSFGLSRNSVYSVVINLDALAMPMHDDKLPVFQNYQDAIIYEAHIRDLGSDPHVPFTYPRSFLAACESGLKLDGHPVGFDYIKSLGITHLQLLPVTDYRSVNEFNIVQSYNWGYDPYQYFALEGSYASIPDDPTSRIRDFLTLVSHYHLAGIRINIDVVFNHVYDYQHSPLEILVPGYYFRKLPNGQMSNGSFCGNDLASEKTMVRHLIIQAAIHVVKTFHLDGFRFDLMGILDRETLMILVKELRKLNPDFMFYGEGWNMPTHLPMELKGVTENSHLLPDFAFFNDTFRNTIKGGNSEHDAHVPGFATGHLEANAMLPYLLLGSSHPAFGSPKVNHADQSINYVECHDNNTFYDKLVVTQPNEGELFHFRRIVFANSLVLFASGIPFFHMAQEVGGSKKGDHNSFQSGDHINQFHYGLIHQRPWLVKAFQDLIALRKFFRSRNPKGWQLEQLQFTHLTHHTTVVEYQLDDERYYFIWNPSLHQVFLPDFYQSLTLCFDGEKRVQQPNNLTHVPPLRFLLLKQS